MEKQQQRSLQEQTEEEFKPAEVKPERVQPAVLLRQSNEVVKYLELGGSECGAAFALVIDRHHAQQTKSHQTKTLHAVVSAGQISFYLVKR